MERVKFIRHKGKKILYIDFRNIDANNYPESIMQVAQSIRKHPKKSLVTLTDLRGTEYVPTDMKALNEFIKGNKPYVKTAAIMGITGIKKIMLKVIEKFSGRRLKEFSEIERAKEWLSTQ